MRSRLLLIILLVGFCGVFGQDAAEETEAANNEQLDTENTNTEVEGNNDDESENNNSEIGNSETDNSENDNSKNDTSKPDNSKYEEKYGYILDEDDDGNKIEPNYDLPCEPNQDIDCIREFFVNKGLCVNSSHEDGKPIYRGGQVTYMPDLNLTVVMPKSVVTFYGSKIETLHFNKRTNNLVMAVNCKGINIYSKFVYFLFEREALEPLISGDYLTANYSAILTAVIPARNGISIRGTRVTAYQNEANPPFEIGPKISNSTNSLIAKTYEEMRNHVPTAVREIFLTESHNFFFLYLQWYICDFGLPMSV